MGSNPMELRNQSGLTTKFHNNKLLLNGPPIAYESDTIAFKIIHQNLQTATCHKVSTSKKFFADIILIKKLSRINTNQCDDIFKVHGHNTTYDWVITSHRHFWHQWSFNNLTVMALWLARMLQIYSKSTHSNALMISSKFHGHILTFEWGMAKNRQKSSSWIIQ